MKQGVWLYPLDSNNASVLIRLNLDFSRKIFNYTGLKTWNSIPTHIRESGTLNQFKNGLKSHFLS